MRPSPWFVAVLVGGMAGPGISAQAPAGVVAFVNATVVDVDAGRSIPGQTVVTRGDRIVSVGARRLVVVPPGAVRVDLHGAWLIPGLWDMHVHLDAEAVEGYPIAERVDYYGSLFLANGVTGVRDAGGNLRRLQAIDSLGRSPATPMPRMVVTSDKLEKMAVREGSAELIRNVKQVRAAIRSLQSAGAQHIKLGPDYPVSLFRATLAECAAAGLRCMSHVPQLDTGAWMSAPGRGSFEHLFGIAEHLSSVPAVRHFENAKEYWLPTRFQRVLYAVRLRRRPMEPERLLVMSRDTLKDRAFFAGMAAAGTWMSPTLMLHHQMTRSVAVLPTAIDPALTLSPKLSEPLTTSDEYRTERRAMWSLFSGLVSGMSRAKVNLLAGTDFSVLHVPGASLRAELVLLQASGLSPREALRAATLNPARYFGATDSLGEVRVGRVADLVVLRSNPLDDIRNVADPEMVMSRGRLLYRADLARMTARAREAAARLRASSKTPTE